MRRILKPTRAWRLFLDGFLQYIHQKCMTFVFTESLGCLWARPDFGVEYKKRRRGHFLLLQPATQFLNIFFLLIYIFTTHPMYYILDVLPACRKCRRYKVTDCYSFLPLQYPTFRSEKRQKKKRHKIQNGASYNGTSWQKQSSTGKSRLLNHAVSAPLDGKRDQISAPLWRPAVEASHTTTTIYYLHILVRLLPSFVSSCTFFPFFLSSFLSWFTFIPKPFLDWSVFCFSLKERSH